MTVTLTPTRGFLKNKYMNAYIHPSAQDFNKVDGLCGEFNGAFKSEKLGLEEENTFNELWR